MFRSFLLIVLIVVSLVRCGPVSWKPVLEGSNQCDPGNPSIAQHPDWKSFVELEEAGQANVCFQVAWGKDATGAFDGSKTTLARLTIEGELIGTDGNALGISIPPSARLVRTRIFAMASASLATKRRICRDVMKDIAYDCFASGERSNCLFVLNFRSNDASATFETKPIDGKEELTCQLGLRSLRVTEQSKESIGPELREPVQEISAEPATDISEPTTDISEPMRTEEGVREPDVVDAGPSERLPDTPCSGGLALCGQVCVDTSKDDKHCGSCGVICSATQACVSGRCKDKAAVRSIIVGHGSFSTCAIFSTGSVKCWGLNSFGQLGTGNKRGLNTPPAIPIDLGAGRTAKQVALGGHGCAVLDNGTLKCWGNNVLGQLGLGNQTELLIPTVTVALGSGRTVKQVGVGSDHTCALLDNGTMKCWGDNRRGQLGLGGFKFLTKPPKDPIELGVGRTATKIAVGLGFSCALLDNGSVKCWGAAAYGALGSGGRTDLDIPPKDPIELGNGRTATDIFAGQFFACAILDDKSTKCWGNGSSGQLGIGTKSDTLAPSNLTINFGAGRSAKKLALGQGHTCAILDDNTVRCWGGNNNGRLGIGGTRSLVAPASTPLNIGQGRTAIDISVGHEHSCVVLDDNTAKCWGFNNEGQLGYGDNKSRDVPPATPISF